MYRDTSSVDCAPRELTHACSRNYRAIALCSILSKILDWIILIKEGSELCSSH